MADNDRHSTEIIIGTPANIHTEYNPSPAFPEVDGVVSTVQIASGHHKKPITIKFIISVLCAFLVIIACTVTALEVIRDNSENDIEQVKSAASVPERAGGLGYVAPDHAPSQEDAAPDDVLSSALLSQNTPIGSAEPAIAAIDLQNSILADEPTDIINGFSEYDFDKLMQGIDEVKHGGSQEEQVKGVFDLVLSVGNAISVFNPAAEPVVKTIEVLGDILFNVFGVRDKKEHDEEAIFSKIMQQAIQSFKKILSDRDLIDLQSRMETLTTLAQDVLDHIKDKDLSAYYINEKIKRLFGAMNDVKADINSDILQVAKAINDNKDKKDISTVEETVSQLHKLIQMVSLKDILFKLIANIVGNVDKYDGKIDLGPDIKKNNHRDLVFQLDPLKFIQEPHISNMVFMSVFYSISNPKNSMMFLQEVFDVPFINFKDEVGNQGFRIYHKPGHGTEPVYYFNWYFDQTLWNTGLYYYHLNYYVQTKKTDWQVLGAEEIWPGKFFLSNYEVWSGIAQQKRYGTLKHTSLTGSPVPETDDMPVAIFKVEGKWIIAHSKGYKFLYDKGGSTIAFTIDDPGYGGYWYIEKN
eukprot:327682_1